MVFQNFRLNDTFTGTTGNYDITVTHNNHEHFNNKMNSENNYTRAIMFNNNLELSSTSPWNTNKIEYLSDYDEVEATSSVSLDYSTDTPSIGALPSTDEESWIRYDNSVWENKKHTTFSTVYTNNNSSYSTMRTLGYTLDNFLSENVSYKDSNDAGFTLEDFIIKNGYFN